MSKYCIIIPVYNHGKELLQVLEQLGGYKLNCFIINDGSGPETNNYIDLDLPIINIDFCLF